MSIYFSNRGDSRAFQTFRKSAGPMRIRPAVMALSADLFAKPAVAMAAGFLLFYLRE